MKISEVAALTNTSTKTLRFYENSGLLPPPARTASGYRNYGPEIVDRLRFIHRGQAAGLALQDTQQGGRPIMDFRSEIPQPTAGPPRVATKYYVGARRDQLFIERL
ncbi:MerR family transcriptional regulator [Mycobacterium tuberculosis]|nr:MerR family transcriptional regulator [Mycobacterium tuberculosis]SGC97304.1 MerR family transcriptional regulator [Mycobacterium tuberculosis]SGG26489.1 MerR family transcriptional regulator [Mycobacterium tuberculosis]